ncbi:hypothetical protein GV828_11740 [Flavobacterium sp. NST-5]|uniref:Lipoprotein n=1 Tax=Flavobacterium ichthyis TaxID=2698827 RepID=A0ABW9ZAD8_9FLAO|nr:hypothetical protein [Flavobacterium ichthyis]NBL65873.1 hypothetical protein [Flavobacterium ichthyis]
MKKIQLFAGAAIIALGMTSCKSETEQRAEKSFDMFENYVDSVSNFSAEEAQANWQAIEADYNTRMAEAEAALVNMKDQENAQKRLDDSRTQYEELKTKAQASMPAPAEGDAAMGDRVQNLRDSFFGAGKIGQDMSFAWVNKDNILSVYQNFVDTFNKNKDSYSREDFDEIKAMYEALDAHKNTVEKQGLSSEDNRKIAALKLEFAPKFKWERMGAKAEENQDAKQ